MASVTQHNLSQQFWRALAACALVLTAACGSTVGYFDFPPFAPRRDAAQLSVEEAIAAQPVMVVAHRGCWAQAPENSIAALDACVSMGVDMAEIDVRTTADGVLVLMHDASVDRTTNAKGLVEQFTYKNLSQLRLRRTDGGSMAKLTRRKVPTLTQALDYARGRLLLNLDVKAADAAAVFAAVEAAGAQDHVLFKSKAPASDPKLARQPYMGKAAFMPIIKSCGGGKNEKPPSCALDLTTALTSYAPFAPVAYEVVFADAPFFDEAAPALAQSGKALWVNSLSARLSGGRSDAKALKDPASVWGALIAQGTRLIQTDEPEALIAYLEREGLR
ncbi:MAG: glycerophosphodiester phosphodiesterase family protein [Pseudomonadota bacterium]